MDSSNDIIVLGNANALSRPEISMDELNDFMDAAPIQPEPEEPEKLGNLAETKPLLFYHPAKVGSNDAGDIYRDVSGSMYVKDGRTGEMKRMNKPLSKKARKRMMVRMEKIHGK